MEQRVKAVNLPPNTTKAITCSRDDKVIKEFVQKSIDDALVKFSKVLFEEKMKEAACRLSPLS